MAKSKSALTARIEVGFTADDSFLSNVIGYFGGGIFAHMTNYVSDDTVIDARINKLKGYGRTVPAGVYYRPARYLNRNEIFLKLALPCTPAQRTQWLADLDSQKTKPYDVVGIENFVTGRYAARDWRAQDSWFCSELGAWAQEKNQIIPTLVIPFWRLTPGAMALIDLAAGGIVVAYRGAVIEKALRATEKVTI